MSDPYASIAVRVKSDPYADIATPAKASPPKGNKARADARKRVRNTPSGVRAFTQGVSFGFADEADAALAAGETAINNTVSKLFGRKGAGYTAKDAYGAVMAENQIADEEFTRERPVTSAALRIGGAVVTPGVAAAGRFVQGASSLGGAVGRSALVGAGMGALSGAGSSSPGVENRTEGALKGGALGGALGAATPIAARAAQTAGRAIDNATGGRIGSLLGGHQVRAAQRLRDALQADGVDDATINRLTAEWEATGAPGPMLMNVAGENTRRLVRVAGMKGGDAAVTLGGIGDRARANMPGQARTRVRQLTPGEGRSALDVVADATEARGVAAERNYAGPYRTRVPFTEEARSALSDEPGRAALRRARAAAVARRNYDQVQEIDLLLEGGDSLPASVTAGTLDRSRIAMGGRGAKMQQSPDTRDIAGGLFGRASDIDNALDAVPEIQGARGNFRAQSEFIQGVEDIGPSALTMPADEFAPQFERLAPSALSASREGSKIGARQAMSDAFGKGPTGARNTLDKIADAEDAQRNLRSMFGEEADRFIGAIRNIRKSVKDAQFVDANVGSKTAPAGQDASAANGVMNFLRNAGSPGMMLIEKLMKGATLTQQEAAIIAEIATSGPRQALTRMRPTAVQRGQSALTGRAGRALPSVAAPTQSPREIEINASTDPEHLEWRRSQGLN